MTAKTCAMRCELLVVAMTMHMSREKRSGKRYDFGESAKVSRIVLRSQTSLVCGENETVNLKSVPSVSERETKE